MSDILGLTGKKGAGKDTLAAILTKHFGFVRLAFADELYRQTAEAFRVTVDFLGNRDTKEVPQQELALCNCSNSEFIEVALAQGSTLITRESIVDGQVVETTETVRLSSLERHVAMVLPLSPRVALQLWGTEYRRVMYSDSYWRDIVAKQIIDLGPNAKVVITDVRFPDEGDMLASMGGRILRIIRPALVTSAAYNATQAHPSEIAMDNYSVWRTVMNQEGAPYALEDAVNQVMASLHLG